MQITSKKLKIGLSFTTSNRLQLFLQTLKTLAEACEDISCLQDILVFDDNSTSDQVQDMRRALDEHWGKDYRLTIECKRYEKSPFHHAHLMRLWFYRCQRFDFVFHCEDDWFFQNRRPFLSEALDILESCPEVGQVAFSRSKPEDVDEKVTAKGTNYWIWHYDPQGATHHHRWPHFTLNPSLIRMSAIERVGNFPIRPRFERAYARRWVNVGLKTAYFSDRVCVHMGENQSAYVQNKTRR